MADEKKLRSVARTIFTKTVKELEVLLKAEILDVTTLAITWTLLSEKFESLKDADRAVWEKLIETQIDEEVLVAEISRIDEYTVTYLKLEQLYNQKVTVRDDATSVVSNKTAHSQISRKFKLPLIEFKKFGGDIREWLTFWSQFQKIHTDEEIPLEDKFQYLLQTTIIGSRARAVVESFPPTRENYQKAVESLQTRFGREELLVEVYVRELLKMVLQNTMSKGKYELSSLYDKLETQLRALESLGVTSDKCAAMLFPLVESCLPDDLLRAWQRSSNAENEESDTDKLQKVMKFLKREVESEERIALAREGFGFSSTENKIKHNQKVKSHDSFIPTATGLINNEAICCIFCGNRSHPSVNCFKAQKMNFEEKRQVLSKQKACFSCLKPGHQSSKCRERLRCLICTERHVILMCPNLPSEKNKTKQEKLKTESSTAISIVGDMTLANHTETPVFLQTLRVKLRSNTKENDVRAIIDTGSQRTYILKSTVQFMGYSAKRNEKLVHALFGGISSSQEFHKCYDVEVVSIDREYSCTVEALDQSVICNNVPSISQETWIRELVDLDISLSDKEGADQIELLIGADIAGLLFTGRKHSLKCGLTVLDTSLGWTVIGKVNRSNFQNDTKTYTSLLNRDLSITELWKLETIGIADPIERKTKQQAETAVNEFFQETICTDDDQRYEVRLPWVDGHPPLARNEGLALNRLTKTVKKLKTAKCYKEYKQVLSTWIQEGIIEKVPQEDMSKISHYLPHRAVIKPSSLTTKVRPVFDASAHEKNTPSLNDCLETGENLLELIPQILIRFRLFKYGMSADICKAFLQIGVCKEDRDYLRFLWMNEDGIILHLRHRRVVFGLCASPFLLGATIKYHLKKMQEMNKIDLENKKVAELLMNSFYVDNCLISMPTKEDVDMFQQAASQIMATGKFDLRGWEITQWDEKEKQPTTVLGMQWDCGHDTLCINSIQTNEDNLYITKREILSLAQRIYDPIGYLCPALLQPKLLLQRLWDLKINWDDEVPTDVRDEFFHWKSEVSLLHAIRIPRWINGTPGEENQWSLHTFVDASNNAYAAAVFLRVQSNNIVHVHLLQAKTRVSPLRKLTIPRLELLAATIGARLFDNVKQALKVSDIKSYFWSDSSTVVAWIQCEEQWGTFVWNRVVEIRKLTPKENWRHIPGTENPADLPSRGCSPKYLAQSKWWEGPAWLLQDSKSWPTSVVLLDEEEVNSEKKKKVAVAMLTTTSEEASRFYSYFSCYNKLVRMIAWINRFLNNCDIRHEKRRGELSSTEFQKAEMLLIRLVQHEAFNTENKQLSTLDTFVDEDGVVWLKTRVSCRNDTSDFRFPMVLPAKHPVVVRLVRDCHLQHCHTGVQTLMMVLREKF